MHLLFSKVTWATKQFHFHLPSTKMPAGLLKPKTLNLEDTNIALLGSKFEKDARFAAASTEAAWKTAGKQPGVEVWRIEKFKVVPWPKEQYGQFYSGDSYIVLYTYKKTPAAEKFSYNVHFWLGLETTQDEAGTAAYKTVELDDFLGTLPVQYREIQNYETDLFLSYFPRYRVESGGVETGFRHVEPEKYRSRLLWIKSKGKTVTIREVPISHTSLNSGDVFLLDCGHQLYQWQGKNSSAQERFKASQLSSAIDSEPENDGDLAPFWKALGGQGPVKETDDYEETVKQTVGAQKRLMRVSDASGQVKFDQINKPQFSKKDFDSKDVFVFDIGSCVFVWVGKQSTAQERKRGQEFAQTYLIQQKRPVFVTIVRISDGDEPAEFQKSLN